MDQQQLTAAWQCRGHATWQWKDVESHSSERATHGWMDPKELHGLEKGVPFNCFGFLVSMLVLIRGKNGWWIRDGGK